MNFWKKSAHFSIASRSIVIFLTHTKVAVPQKWKLTVMELKCGRSCSISSITRLVYYGLLGNRYWNKKFNRPSSMKDRLIRLRAVHFKSYLALGAPPLGGLAIKIKFPEGFRPVPFKLNDEWFDIFNFI